MKNVENVEILIKKFCADKKAHVKTTPELDERILADALPAQNELETAQSVAVQPHIWRTIMRNRIIKYAAAAMIILAIIIGFIELGKPVGASVAFAAAMLRVREAGTFSCTEIFDASYEDAGEQGKYLLKQKWMFKEPDWERHESLTSPWSKYIGETTITDYGTRQKLVLRPVEKTARLYNLVSEYTIDDETGELKLTQLDTRLRDRLLEWSQGAVDDHGEVKLDGRSARVLQSRRGNRVTTVWIDPETNYPVQIELKWTDQNRSPVMYTSIQIDTELDDDLFSLEPPAGYSFTIDKSAWPDSKAKMAAKMRHLGKCCMVYANRHNDQYPSKFADLVTGSIITDEALRRVRSAPGDPDGPPVIQYRQPDTSVADWSNEVMLYEDYENRSADDLVAVTWLDSHAELIPVRVLEQYLKPWPAHKKKVSACVAYLYGFCGQYAKEHDGRYPEELAELVGWDISEETIKRLLSTWGLRDGSQVIQYYPPRADGDPATEVMFCELYDQWPEDGAVVCYADGNCEIITDQNHFEELIK
jgi:outer membrane lipoprotein-sorting protein